MATCPPTIAPMLEPPTWSIGIPSSSSALITPMWAIPRAPPPPSTRPTARPVRWRATRATSLSTYRRTWWHVREGVGGQPCPGGLAAPGVREQDQLEGWRGERVDVGLHERRHRRQVRRLVRRRRRAAPARPGARHATRRPCRGCRRSRSSAAGGAASRSPAPTTWWPVNRRRASTNQSKSAGAAAATITVSSDEPSAAGSYLKAIRAASIPATRVATSGDVAIKVVNTCGGSRTSRASRTTTAVRDRPPPMSRAPSPNVMPGPASAVMTGRPSSSAKNRTRPATRPYIPSGSSPRLNSRAPAGTRSHSTAAASASRPASSSWRNTTQAAEQLTGVRRRAVDHVIDRERTYVIDDANLVRPDRAPARQARPELRDGSRWGHSSVA